ncbi:MAG: deoxyribodipyrimidine photo-lyase [Pseudomonadales bacterium]|nr:deoxyribodipyrimidine photo-lyase [Pseudomonadales bacterium]
MTSNSSKHKRALVWFRRDLRVFDNPALYQACQSSREVIAVYILTDKQWDIHRIGNNHRWFFIETLKVLEKKLSDLNIQLLLLDGKDYKKTPGVLLNCCKNNAIDAVYFNKELEINERLRDQAIEDSFAQHSIEVKSYCEQTLAAPGNIITKEGKCFRVFTPFKRAFTITWNVATLILRRCPHPQSGKRWLA